MKIMHYKKMASGYSLLELMIVLVVIAILTIIAVLSYQYYQQQIQHYRIQQEMHNIALQLERFKIKNLSYQGFDVKNLYPTQADQQGIKLPQHKPTHLLQVLDLTSERPLSQSGNAGRNWVIYAKALSDEKNMVQTKDYLMTSTGVNCYIESKIGVANMQACE